MQQQPPAGAAAQAGAAAGAVVVPPPPGGVVGAAAGGQAPVIFARAPAERVQDLLDYIYKRGPGWGFPDRVKYLFLPGFYKFPRFGSTVLFWVLFFELLTCLRSHFGQNCFSIVNPVISPGFYVFVLLSR